MNSVRLPLIPINALTCVRPEFLGLAAWLGVSNIYPTERTKILRHVAEHGSLDETALHKGFDSADELAAAAQAHAEWQRFLVELNPTAPKAAPIVFHRTGNGLSLDPAGVNGQEDPADEHPF